MNAQWVLRSMFSLSSVWQKVLRENMIADNFIIIWYMLAVSDWCFFSWLPWVTQLASWTTWLSQLYPISHCVSSLMLPGCQKVKESYCLQHLNSGPSDLSFLLFSLPWKEVALSLGTLQRSALELISLDSSLIPQRPIYWMQQQLVVLAGDGGSFKTLGLMERSQDTGCNAHERICLGEFCS